MVRHQIKLKVGDTVDHDEFGIGTVERQCAKPGLFSINFGEESKLIPETSKNFITVNGKSLSVIKRQLVTEEAYEASKYSRYDHKLLDGDFADILPVEPELVEALDAICADRGTMKIGCNPSYEAQAIKQLTAAGTPELIPYLQIGKSDGEESHGFWINIFVPYPLIADIDTRLHMFFNPRLLVSKGVYQLSKLSYNRRLLGKVTMHGAPEDETTEDLVLDS
jgi:hypothetical protein